MENLSGRPRAAAGIAHDLMCKEPLEIVRQLWPPQADGSWARGGALPSSVTHTALETASRTCPHTQTGRHVAYSSGPDRRYHTRS